MTAKKYEYSGSPVHVKVVTKVRLKITAIMVSGLAAFLTAPHLHLGPRMLAVEEGRNYSD